MGTNNGKVPGDTKMRISLYVKIIAAVCVFFLGLIAGIFVERWWKERDLPGMMASRFEKGMGRPWHGDGMRHKPFELMTKDERISFERERAEFENRMKARYMKMLTDELTLSKEQADAITKILDANKRQADAIRDTFRTDLAKVTGKVNSDIAAALNAEQRVKYEKMIARMPMGIPLPPPGHMPLHGEGPPPEKR